MESLNMNTLANSLPTSNLANAEKDLMNNFKAAAMSITTLYRSSLHTSKRAYNAGYGAALQDLLDVIQQGVSVGGVGGAGSEGGMTIGRVMDWVEARLEAVKAREEEEDEEEREREGKATANATASKGPPASGLARDKEKVESTSQRSTNVMPLRTPLSPTLPPRPVNQVSVSPSPPTPVLRPLPRQKHRAAKDNKDATIIPPASDSFSFLPPLGLGRDMPTSAMITDSTRFLTDIEVVPSPMVGSKRRHASMVDTSSPLSVTSLENSPGTVSYQPMPLSGAPSVHANANAGASMGSTSRRRGKAGRSVVMSNVPAMQNQNQHQGQNDAMDVEENENGRERKRIARR